MKKNKIANKIIEKDKLIDSDISSDNLSDEFNQIVSGNKVNSNSTSNSTSNSKSNSTSNSKSNSTSNSKSNQKKIVSTLINSEVESSDDSVCSEELNKLNNSTKKKLYDNNLDSDYDFDYNSDAESDSTKKYGFGIRKINSADTKNNKTTLSKLNNNNQYDNIDNNKNLQNNQVTKLPIKEVSIEDNLEFLYKELNAILLSSKLKSLIGELISFKISGYNAYISVKISEYQINCNFWQIAKSKDLNTYKSFKEGDKIKLDGYFSILQKSFSVYFNVKSMGKVGMGDYLALHDLNRKKIKELGWDLNKKILDKFPYTIGIITAIEGAAIQDILQAFKLDNFIGNIIIINAVVQGKQCPQSIINKIEWAEQNYPDLDVLMITRGGGSFEDLVGFSDWDLVKRIKTSKLITLSAVGHQIDNQLSDEVADYKFATPSLGAKFITGLQQTYIDKFKNYKLMIKFYENKFKECKERTDLIAKSYDKIISNYNIKEIREKLYKYSVFVKNKINSYNQAKNKYLNMTTSIQPKIFKAGKEITSINDIINTSPKKIEIILPDGRAVISYRIIEFHEN